MCLCRMVIFGFCFVDWCGFVDFVGWFLWFCGFGEFWFCCEFATACVF